MVDYARVLEYSLKVLHWRAGNTKALYRAGVASLELGDAQTARQYLLQASRSTPNGKNKSHLLYLIYKDVQLQCVLTGDITVLDIEIM